MRIIDETGNRYGCLIVIERDENTGRGVMWKCLCDCGKSVSVSGAKLRFRNRTRCGTRCKNKFGKYWDVRNEVGNRYGKLVVVERDFDKQISDGVYKQIRWICKCDCGNIVSVRGVNLRKKQTRSCGCLRKLQANESAFRIFYNSIKQGAKTRGYVFDLSHNDVKEISTQNCFYCGSEPKQCVKTNTGVFFHNGIDRIDNNFGYTKENSVPCCKRCNFAKHKLSVKEFSEMIKSIYTYWANKE